MRSLLFVPGDSPRKFDKASQGNASALIVDLEDSVVPDKKDEARGLTRTMLGGRRGSHQLYVRVNALDTGMTLQDLAAVMPTAPDGIVLPKCRPQRFSISPMTRGPSSALPRRASAAIRTSRRFLPARLSSIWVRVRPARSCRRQYASARDMSLCCSQRM